MMVGNAIDPLREEHALYIAPGTQITNETLKLIKVWKCPKCGHSEKMEGDDHK